jgi:hypothetical protein
MAAIRGKKALYEVISKSRPKSLPYKDLGPKASRPAQRDRPAGRTGGTFGLPGRPYMVRFSGGRFELSVPYQLAVAILLGMVLLAVVVFRLGQGSMRQGGGAAGHAAAAADGPAAPLRVENAPVLGEAGGAGLEGAGSNRIVIQTFKVRAHLEPASDYFARAGLETEIKRIGDWYYLVTRDKFENTDNPQGDGYRVRQKIIRLGAEYKAPPGYETFGPKPFHDCYGMKFDD